MTKRIFRSSFLAAMTVLLAALTLVMGAVHSYFTRVQIQQLHIETALAAQAAANEGLSYFEDLQTVGCRITWIDSSGRVLYDNRRNSGSMESHLQRSEVAQALETGWGESVRYSSTLLERYIYAARRLPDGTVLRLSTSQDSVLSLVLNMAGPIGGIIAVTSLLTWFLSHRLARKVVRPLNELDLDAPLSNREYEEIRPLLRRLDAQQAQLRSQSEELKQKQKQFNTVIRAMSEGLVLMDAEGTILSINPAASSLLGITQNCLGADFSVANQNETIAALANGALAGKKMEQTVTLAEGEYLAATSPVRSEGRVFGVVLLLFDVTQKRRAEELRREFTANVSHELKTPLHAILGYGELLKSGLVPPEDIPLFSEKIYSQAQRMNRLVEDTLRLSRLDEGAADLQWTPLDLMTAAREAVRELTASAELGGVTLTLEGSGASIRGIPQLVRAIVFNLTENAVKYTRPGGSVTVRVEDLDSTASITVADTGIGIPEAEQDRVFERFYRVDKSHSAGGTGLGLSIVKHAAAILGAEVTLNSTPEEGTTVSVLFRK